MKVLHVCESVLGGTGAHLNELLPLQQKLLGRDNVVLLGPAEHFSQIPDIDRSAVLTYRRQNRKTGLLRLARAFVASMRSFRPDLVHAHSTFAGLITRLLSPFFGVPVVYCPHSWATEMEQSPLAKWSVGWIERNLSYLCKAIIAVSEHERKRGIELGIPGDKIVTVYNGIALQAPAFAPLPWNDARLKVLYVGRFDRQKGIDVLLDAIMPLQDRISVHVIGGSVVGRAKIDFSRYPHVQAFGWLDSAGVMSHIASCDVVVMPSRWEGLPITALEAMRLSKPLIAASVGGIPEIVSEGQNGHLFACGDVAALRNLLQGADPAELARMGQAGRAKFLDVFNAERMCAGIMDVYRAVEGGGLKP